MYTFTLYPMAGVDSFRSATLRGVVPAFHVFWHTSKVYSPTHNLPAEWCKQRSAFSSLSLYRSRCSSLLPLSAFVTRPSIVGERLKAILEVVSKDLVGVQRSRQREAHGE